MRRIRVKGKDGITRCINVLDWSDLDGGPGPGGGGDAGGGGGGPASDQETWDKLLSTVWNQLLTTTWDNMKV